MPNILQKIGLFIFLTTSGWCEIGPQMDDFLCGCDYCITVNRGEPLDISGHMMRCHSWRKAVTRTMELMNRTPQPEVEIISRQETPKDINITNHQYNWSEDVLYGWVFSDSKQTAKHEDHWLYTENLEWVWVFEPHRNYSYSYRYGWLYTRIYKGTRVVYWYDKRLWKIPNAHMTFD